MSFCFWRNHVTDMQGISTLATIISVFSFSLMGVVLLYPNLSSFKSRWKGVAFYGGVSVSTLLAAALTAPAPASFDQEWSWVDWTVIGLGLGSGIAVVTRNLWWPRIKKQVGPAVQQGKEKPVERKNSYFAKRKRSR